MGSETIRILRRLRNENAELREKVRYLQMRESHEEEMAEKIEQLQDAHRKRRSWEIAASSLCIKNLFMAVLTGMMVPWTERVVPENDRMDGEASRIEVDRQDDMPYVFFAFDAADEFVVTAIWDDETNFDAEREAAINRFAKVSSADAVQQKFTGEFTGELKEVTIPESCPGGQWRLGEIVHVVHGSPREELIEPPEQSKPDGTWRDRPALL